MGDPRPLRKKYSGSGHPWQKARLEEEKKLKKDFALKNKKELHKAESKLKGFAGQAKKLTALRTAQSEVETKQLIGRLSRLGLVGTGAKLDDVLRLGVQDVLSRRLQTLVHKKGLARTPKQARQFIAHQHITVAGKTMTAPGYLVPLADEGTLSFKPASNLANEDHPERVNETKEIAEEVEKVTKKKARSKKEEKTKEEKKTEKVKEETKEKEEKQTEAKQEPVEETKKEKSDVEEDKKKETKEEKPEEVKE